MISGDSDTYICEQALNFAIQTSSNVQFSGIRDRAEMNKREILIYTSLILFVILVSCRGDGYTEKS